MTEPRRPTGQLLEPVAPSRALAAYWVTFAALVLATVLAAAIRWSLAHPFGLHWDESAYLNEALIDGQRLRHGMLLKFAGRILLRSWGRPPAYRIVGDPILALLGGGTTSARLVSLACYALSTFYVYRAAALLSNRIGGAVAALIFSLSPEVIAAGSFFGTDSPLYLATAATLFYVLRKLAAPREHRRDWIGLGLALALGFLAKTTFFLIAPPALLLWSFLVIRRRFAGPGWSYLAKAAALLLVLAGPWWLLNLKGAIAYGQYARGFTRNSLGSPSPATWLRWLNSVAQCLIGHALSVLIALILIAFVVQFLRNPQILRSLQKAAMGLCACSGMPILLWQLSGTNHLLRHISPAMIPLAIVAGLLADLTVLPHHLPGIAVCSTLIAVQLGMIVYPVLVPNRTPVDIGFVNGTLPWRVLARYDQWNWNPVWQVSQACHLPSPRIAYLGGGREFNPPAIQYPWVAAALPTRLSTLPYPDVTWLWRYEDGALNWQMVIDAAAQSDLVITAPDFTGSTLSRDNQDNQYNAEFAARLSQDPRFQKPLSFRTGRFQPVQIMIFPTSGLSCSPSPLPASEPKRK